MMPNIKPISDLRNYAKVLSEVHENEPVYLTKNGRGAYAIVDIKDQETIRKAEAFSWLLSELRKGERDIERGDTVTDDEITTYFERKHEND